MTVLRRAWRAVRARPRLFIGLLLGLVTYQLLPSTLGRTTRSIIAWDFGVVAYLSLAAYLFASEHLDRMPADAAAQEEGE